MPTQFTLNLLGEFAVYQDMEHVVLPPSCRRVVALAPHVRVDWHQAVRLIGRLPAARTSVDPKLRHPLRHGDLLDGWTDSWCAALEIASSP